MAGGGGGEVTARSPLRRAASWTQMRAAHGPGSLTYLLLAAPLAKKLTAVNREEGNLFGP